ncbi:MAG: CehA/McbA family metallohydrolase [Ignisphaera sp.]
MLHISDRDLHVKAALHTHSTSSDGKLAPKDVVDFYKNHGYGVVALTDHNKITRIEVKDFDDPLVIQGMEISKGRSALEEPYHLVVLGIEDDSIARIGDLQELMDFVNRSGGIAILAHPHWSGLVYQDLISIQGYAAMEIFNYGCEVEVSKGFALSSWDSLLSSGYRVWGVAVDDSHRYVFPPIDADGGWTVLLLRELNTDEVFKAIRSGGFYSSTGAVIKKLMVDGNYIEVATCSARRITLISENGKGFSIGSDDVDWLINNIGDVEKIKSVVDEIDIVREGNRTIVVFTKNQTRISAVMDSNGIDLLTVDRFKWGRYLRVEVMDFQGGKAWSNPIASQ